MTLQLITQKLNIQESELTGPSRESRFVEARHAHWYLLRKKHTLQQIANLYNRTHATVYSGVKRASGLIEIHDRKMMELINILSPVDEAEKNK